MGLLHIYCGDGKGKTTAAAGLALRMAGNGKKVVLVRFLKHEDSGEVRALQSVSGVEVLPCSRCFGFTWQMTEEEKQKAKVSYTEQLRRAWKLAQKLCESAGQGTAAPQLCRDAAGDKEETAADVLLILDEACAALEHGFLELSEVLALLTHRPPNLEVVLTGRRPAKELLERADYVTEMKELSHPYERGIRARRGIEY